MPLAWYGSRRRCRTSWVPGLNPGAGLGHHRNGVAGHQGGVRVGQHVQAAEELDQSDRDQHHDVERGQKPVLRVPALGPVVRLQQPAQQHQGQQRCRAQHQRDPHPVRFLREQGAVAHPVGPVRVRLGERAGQPAVVLVVVSRQALPQSAETSGVPGPVRRHPQPGRGGRTGLLPGARRRRRHESSPHTRVSARVIGVVPVAWLPPSAAVDAWQPLLLTHRTIGSNGLSNPPTAPGIPQLPRTGGIVASRVLRCSS